MWVLKLETSHHGTVVANLAKKYRISFSGYPIKFNKTSSHLVVQVCGFVNVKKERQKQLLKKIKKEKVFEKIYINNDFIIASIKLPLWLTVLYSPDIIFIKPQNYTYDGKEIMELASWSKEPLMNLVKVYKKKYNTRILIFAKRNIKNISLISLHPELTDKQKLALKLAVENGYYEFPKKITLKKLAKLMKVSFSTYHAHLSKAESRFIPEMFNSFS
jgi:predicted DNA binding protein